MTFDEKARKQMKKILDSELKMLDERPSVRAAVEAKLDEGKKLNLRVVIVLALAAFLLTGTAFAVMKNRRVESYQAVPDVGAEHMAREGQLVPLSDGGTGAFYVDGQQAGVVFAVYQTFFEAADEKHWAKVGLEPLRGIAEWEKLLEAAEAVKTYNEKNGEAILLMKGQPERFPKEFVFPDETGKELLLSVTGESGKGLLTECILPLEALSRKNLLAGVKAGEQVIPFARKETRVLVWPKGEQEPEEPPQLPVYQTGLVPADMDYQAFCDVWSGDAVIPSEENFLLWKQMMDEQKDLP